MLGVEEIFRFSLSLFLSFSFEVNGILGVFLMTKTRTKTFNEDIYFFFIKKKVVIKEIVGKLSIINELKTTTAIRLSSDATRLTEET